MKTVIYHRADFDGLFCYQIAKKFLGDKDVQYIGWDFGDPAIPLPINGEFVIMDLPVDRPFGLEFRDGWLMRGQEQFQPIDRVDWGKFTWIDHHKSSIESHPKDIPGYRIDGVAACRLAWQWFSKQAGVSEWLPSKEHFISRQATEPTAVRLAGEYDIWDHRGDGDLELQFGLRSEGVVMWNWLLSDAHAGTTYVNELIATGGKIMAYQSAMDERMMGNSFIVEFEGLKFLACNAGGRNSNAFASKDVLETGHDALLAFYYNGKGTLMVSLYHARHRKDLDLSPIAVKYGRLSGLGGGGHPGACGFQWPMAQPLPFIQANT